MEESQPQGLRASLTVGEQHWAWKLGFRIALLVLDIIGIGCVGYATAASVNLSTWWIDSWAIPWGLITLTISFLWCFVCIVVLLARKRPVHPGAIVGVDLILWLSFLVTALFALAGLFSIISFGDAGYISDYSSSSGGYYLASNNTWVWNSTSSYYYSSSSSNSRSCSNYGFSSCAEQDDMVNRLWQERGTLVATEATGVAMQFLGLLGHFILLVWGCVDCHRRRSQKTSKQAEEIARKIIEDMTRRGQIVPAQQQMAMPLLGHAAEAGGREMVRNGESEASRTASMSGALGEQSGSQQMRQLSPLPTQHSHTTTLPQGHTAPSHRSISPIEANDDAITPQPQAHPQPPHQQTGV